MGPLRVKEIMLTSRVIGGAESVSLGLANLRAAPGSRLEEGGLASAPAVPLLLEPPGRGGPASASESVYRRSKIFKLSGKTFDTANAGPVGG